MLDRIKYFADNSETLKQARINVEEISPIKEIGIFIALFLVLCVFLLIFQYIFCIFNLYMVQIMKATFQSLVLQKLKTA